MLEEVELKNISSYLYVFNLSTDLDNDVLAFTHDWAEEFSHHFDKVFIYSTHLGNTKLPKNVFTQELGGGTAIKRVKAILKILAALIHIVLYSKNRFVFYHMNARVASIIGLPLKILRVPQILWYSHAHASFSLRLATNFVDRVVSTSNSSLPFKTKKLRTTGHGVRDKNVFRATEIHSLESISFLGRVSRVKRIEILIEEVSIFQKLTERKFKIYVIGPCEAPQDKRYKAELIALAKKRNVELIFMGSIPHKNVQLELSKYDVAFNGTLQSLDKGAIESVFAKCLLISDQSNTLIECGYSNFSLDSSGRALKISQQLRLMISLSEGQKTALREKARIETLSRHSLSSTINKIITEFSIIVGSNEK